MPLACLRLVSSSILLLRAGSKNPNPGFQTRADGSGEKGCPGDGRSIRLGAVPVSNSAEPLLSRGRPAFQCRGRTRTRIRIATLKAAGAAGAAPRQGITSPAQGPGAVLAAEVIFVPALSLGLGVALGENQLVTSRAARPQQLCVMTATVKTPIVVEVDEVDQGLATGLAGKASPVPAAPLSCPSCEHSVLPWPQRLPAIFTGAFFKFERYQAGHPLSQGLPPSLGTEEPQLSQLLLPKGQAVAIIAVLWRELLEEAPEPGPTGGRGGIQARVPPAQNFRILSRGLLRVLLGHEV